MSKIKTNSLAVFLLLSLFIAFTLLNAQLKTIFIGVKVVQTNNGDWMVTKLDQQGWAITSGVQIGDQLISVNGQPPNQYFATKFESVEQASELEVIRQGEKMIFNVDGQFNSTNTYEQIFASALLFIILFLFSFFLFIKKREDSAANLLILFFMTLAICYLSSGASSRLVMVAQLLLILTITHVPVVFLHFLNCYFSKLHIEVLKPRLLYGFYGINALLFLLYALIVYTDLGYTIKYSWLAQSSLLIFSIGFMLMVYILITKYIEFRHTIYNPLFKYMIIGHIVSFSPFIFLYALPNIFVRQEILPANIAAVSLLSLPIVYVYLIVSKQLMDIDFIIHRLRYYCAFAVIPTTIIVGGIILVNYEIDNSLSQWLQIIGIVYLVVVLFLYFMGKFEYHPLFKTKRNYQVSLNRFSQQISKVATKADLEKIVLTEVLKMLPIELAVILEVSSDDQTVKIGKTDVDVPKIQFSDLSSGRRTYEIGEMIELDNGLCILIGKQQKTQYYLVIGWKLNRMGYNPDELVWLRTLANYVGILYENLEMIAGLISEFELRKDQQTPAWISRLVFSLAENERRRLASDLHDSALQDQLLWYRRFESLLDEGQIPDHVHSKMEDIKEGLLDVIHQIRQTCNELRPPFLKEIGAIDAIHQLCMNAQMNANFNVEFVYPSLSLEMDDDYVLTIYRLTQELLRNTMKHAAATEVYLEISNDAEQLVYRYRDNGVGMDLRQLKSSFSHMGLSGIRERVVSFNGKVEFRSAPGEGFEACITFPLMDKSIASQENKAV